MLCLNSVLIEGAVIEVNSAEDSEEAIAFKIRSMRVGKDTDEFKKSFLNVWVIVNGRLAGAVREQFKEQGSKLECRIVGRLAQENEKIYIHGEHVEFKPRKLRDDESCNS
jgi:hypothetical protein